MPKSSSYESDPAFSRRQRRVTLVEESRRRRRKRKLMIGIVVLIIALIAACIVAYLTFFKSTDDKLKLTESNADQALVAADRESPYYVLCSADLSRKYYTYANEYGKAYMLVRVDEPSRSLSFLTIPGMLKLNCSDGESRQVQEMSAAGGDAMLIESIAKFAEIGISHFAMTDADKLGELVELVGGVTMNISGEIDDPDAGNIVIRSGEQKLDSKSALTLLRATNVYGGFPTCADNRVDFTLALASSALESQGIGFASIVGDASQFVETDMTTQDLLNLGDTFRPIDTATVYEVVVPYTVPAAGNNDPSYMLSKSEWERVRQAFVNGEDPSKIDDYLKDVDTSGATVEIRNGAGINGAAARLGESLVQFGYEIEGVGNTQEGIVYPETLIVYTDPEYEDIAKVLMGELGVGRTVNGGDFYSSKANIIVIIGADWTL